MLVSSEKPTSVYEVDVSLAIFISENQVGL